MPPKPVLFEDFRPGQRFLSEARLVTEGDLKAFASVSGDCHRLHSDPDFAAAAGFAKPILHGPFGIAAFLGWFFESRIASESLIAMLDSHWRYHAPIMVGDAISFEMTITRCRRSSSGEKGVVGRHVHVRNQSGTLVQEGRSALLVRARGDAPTPAREFLTGAWASQLAERLDRDEAFRSATATWDGAFALACDNDEVQFRIFRGRVIEAGVRSPNGPVFTVVAEELTWVELLTAGSNELMQRAMRSQISVRGSAYEYLRLTRALTRLVDVARQMFVEGTAT